MSAFNDIHGVPASGNPHAHRYPARRVGLPGLRGVRLGFGGTLDSDHGFAADRAEAARKGLTAGVDMEMEGGTYAENLARLVREKKIPLAVVDQAVRRVLRVKYHLGLFDHPSPADPDKEQAAFLTPENLALAREDARSAIVLLKNDGQILPLSKTIGKVAVIGPLGDDQADLLGSWSGKGDAKDVTTLLAGLKAASPKTRFTVVKGCDFDANTVNPKIEDKGIEEAVKAANNADTVILAVGENKWQSGEAAARAFLGLPGRQEELAEKVIATGKPVVVVLMNGRPLALPWLADNAKAIVEAWQLGVQAGPAIADILFGDVAPTGRLPVPSPAPWGRNPSITPAATQAAPPR